MALAACARSATLKPRPRPGRPAPSSPRRCTRARSRKMKSPPSCKGGDLLWSKSETQLLEPPLNRARWFAGLVPTWGFSPSTGSEGMVCRILLRGDLGRFGLALDGAANSLLGSAIVEVLDFLVVLGFPVDEHAHGHVEIVGLIGGNYALGHRIRDGFSDGILRRTEHLHRLARVLDGHLVVQNRCRLAQKI